MAGRRADDLQEDYAEAGFGNRLGFGEAPALLIVDMINAYLVPGAPLYAGVEAELEVCKRLRDRFHAAEFPVIFTRVEYEPGGADGGYFFKKVGALKNLERGNPLGDFPDGLRPADGDIVVTKQYASSFFGTSLASTLNSLGCDTTVIVGVTTSGCVRATALDALQYGFIPIVVSDGCGDRDERVHDANLFDLGAKYADIVTAAEVEGWLANRNSD